MVNTQASTYLVHTHFFLFCRDTHQFILGTYLVHTQYVHFVSMPISRISRQWQTLPTTRMCSCASCVSMLWLDTSRQMRPSSRKSMSILALRQWRRTSIKQSLLHWLTVILTSPARLGLLPFPGRHDQLSIHAVACNGNIPCYACIYQYVLSTNKYKPVCTLYSDCLVMNRLMQTIAWVMYTWTSNF